MNIEFEAAESITIDVSTFLSDRGVLAGDITEVAYFIKVDATDLDEDAIVEKKLTLGEVVYIDPTVVVRLAVTDFGTTADKLQVGEIYKAKLGFLAPSKGWSKYLEGPLADNRVIIKQDFIRA